MVHNLIHHTLGQIDGNSKAYALIPTAVRKDRSINSNQFTSAIYERTAGVSRIDGRVSLNEIFVIFDTEIGSARCADDSHGDRLARAKRVSNPQGKVAALDLS